MKKFLFALCLSLVALTTVAPESVGADNVTGFSINLTAAESATNHNALELKAQIAAPAGTPVAAQKVTFALKVSLLGKDGFEEVGTATTDRQGVATLLYTPRANGSAEFVATWKASGLDSPVAGTFTTTISHAIAGTQVLKAQPLRPIGANLIVALMVLVVIVWLVLFGTLARTFFGLPRAAVSADEASELSMVVAEVAE